MHSKNLIHPEQTWQIPSKTMMRAFEFGRSME
jgi:hypothetical protein